jgi:uncharacterized membrane protein
VRVFWRILGVVVGAALGGLAGYLMQCAGST